MERRTFIIVVAIIMLMSSILLPDKREFMPPHEQWEKYAIDEQKTFGLKCILYGENKIPPRGHTLGGIAQMETSLNLFSDHGEDSYSPFGISLGTAQYVRQELRKDPSYGDLEDFDDDTVILLLENDFNWAADMALWLYQYHIDFFIERGYSPHRAWQLAIQRYAGWNRWESRKTYGKVFREWVKFLRTLEYPEGNPVDLWGNIPVGDRSSLSSDMDDSNGQPREDLWECVTGVCVVMAATGIFTMGIVGWIIAIGFSLLLMAAMALRPVSCWKCKKRVPMITATLYQSDCIYGSFHDRYLCRSCAGKSKRGQHGQISTHGGHH